MKRTFRNVIAAMTVLMLPLAGAKAQEEVEVSVGADVVSSYIWRGQDLGHGAVQPSIGVGYKGFSLSAWGSYGIVKDDTREIDLTLSYTTGGLTIGVTDYYGLSADEFKDAKYFEYAAHKTAHVLEANVGYDFGPVVLNLYTNFAGADGVNDKGKRAYSSYVEVAAPFTLGGMDMSFTAGAVPCATDYYDTANGFAVTNLTLAASRELKITPTFSLPLFAAITANPSASKCYLTVGLSF